MGLIQRLPTLRAKIFLVIFGMCCFLTMFIATLLYVDMDASLIQADIIQYRNRFIWYAAMVLLLASISGVLLARTFADRINVIQSGVTKINKGKFDVTLTIEGNNEIKGSINGLASTTERGATLMTLIKALVQALDGKDSYTGGHSTQVEDIAATIAENVGLTGDKLFAVRFAALLHDVGKIGIPDKILNKTYPLNAAEWELIKQHSEVGAKIVVGIPALAEVATIIRYHHARWDGRGYPATTSWEEIPLGSRIIAIADSFQAMTSDRAYKKKKTTDEALAEIANCRGTQFDPALVDIFLELKNKQLV